MEEKKCKYQTDKQGTCNKGFGKPYCKDNPNCPIKQLQLKDKMIERAKQALIYITTGEQTMFSTVKLAGMEIDTARFLRGAREMAKQALAELEE